MPHDGFEPPPSVKLRVDFVFISFHSAFPSAFVCVVCLVQCPLVIWCDNFLPVFLALVPSQIFLGMRYVLVFVALLLPTSTMQLVVSVCSWVYCLPWSTIVLRFAKTFKQASLCAVY